MKIIMVNNHLRGFGGEGVMFESLSNLLRQKGHQVRLFERDSRKVKGLWKKIGAFTGSIYSLPVKNEFIDILKTVRPDIVHVHNLYPLISPSILIACRKRNIPVVLRCPNLRLICPTGHLFDGRTVCERCSHGREYWCVFKNCRHNIIESTAYALRNLIARNLRQFHNNVTIFEPPSEFVKSMLIKAGYPQDRISTVPNFIFMNNQSLNNTYGSYAAFIGRIVPEKGVATLLSAAQKTGLPVHFAGDYSTMPNIEKVTMKNVRFLGHISRNHITDFFRNARFSVVPSICYETFGLVVIEAMYHGLPVIASRIGGIPEIIEDGVTGFLVEPGNADELSGRMKLLWDNPNLCKRMGQAGRKKVIREYNEDVFYNRTMALYEKAIQFSSTYHKNSDNKPSYTFHHITGDAQCAE